MLKRQFNTFVGAATIFVGNGLSFIYLFFPVLGLLIHCPNLNVFSGTSLDLVVAALSLLVFILGLAVRLGPINRLKAGAWLGGMLMYAWLAASAILRPAPAVLWSRERDALDQVIVAPMALWVISSGVLVVGFSGWHLILLADKAKSMIAAHVPNRWVG